MNSACHSTATSGASKLSRFGHNHTREPTTSLWDLIPRPEHARRAFPPQHADRSGVESEQLSGIWRQFQPPRREYAQHMAVAEKGDVAFLSRNRAERPLNNAIRAGADLFRGFAAGRSAGPDGPPGRGLMDVIGGESFVRAVVPLMEVGIDHGIVACEARRFQRSPHGTGEHQGELVSAQLGA